MLERFTDRARKTMALASQEAQRMNHGYVGTEHILLGLLREGSGFGVKALNNLKLDIKKIRANIEELVKPGKDMVIMGKLPQTPRARKVIEHAIEYARSLHHDYVGTEHIIYGLNEEEEGTAAKVLMKEGVSKSLIDKEVRILLEIPPESSSGKSNLNEDLKYWNVPKDNLSLRKFLKLNGFNVKESVEIDESLVSEIYNRGDLKNEIGRLTEPVAGKIGIEDLKILYDINDTGQLEEAVYLKQLMNKNNVSYEEDPSSSVVSKQLRSSGFKKLDLADKLSGKK